MKEFESINDILDFAVNSEQKAIDFYTNMAAKTNIKHMKTVFEEFADEERSHKERLIRIKEDKVFPTDEIEIADLKIADYLVESSGDKELSYQDALTLAMKREKAAFKLYLKLSEQTNNEKLKKVFKALAQEEAKHKLRFETEFDDYILKEN